MSETGDIPPPLEILDESWQRALVVVPHPDDSAIADGPLHRVLASAEAKVGAG